MVDALKGCESFLLYFEMKEETPQGVVFCWVEKHLKNA